MVAYIVYNDSAVAWFCVICKDTIDQRTAF